MNFLQFKTSVRILATVVALIFFPRISNGQSVTTDKLDYYPGDTVFMEGFDWMPGETVRLVLDIYPAALDNDTLFAQADSNGYFFLDTYIIQPEHLSQIFETYSTGLTSGLTAYTIFYDSPRIISVAMTPASVSICIPSAGTALDSVTVKTGRGGNGTVNGTFTVSGVPAGVTVNTLAGFNSNGGNAFPDRILRFTVSNSAVAGNYTIKVKAADGADSASNTMTLTLNSAPVITCPGNQILSAGSACNATATYSATATGLPVPGITYSIPSGSVFPLNTTAVTATATNVCGSSACSFNITVNDNTPPVATCKNATIYLNSNGQATLSSADINNGSSDNCGIASVVASKTSFDCSNTGANSVTLTVTDNSNNVSTCSATVTVLDTISPVASCKSVTIYLDANGTASITSADINNGSSDNCGIASVVASKTSFDCSNTGANSVTLNVTDNSNNVSTCSAPVTVLDTISPVASCKPATIYLDANGTASITSADINNGSSDNCGIASVVASKTSFDCSNTGANSVTLTVTDNSNNVSTCSAIVTVLDTISPVASCKPATIYLDANGQASITSADINNGSSDNCGIASIVASKTSFDCSNTGANSVTLIVTDNSNNVSTCSATVTVLDTISPVASCKPATIYLDANGQASITSADINNGSSDNCGIASVVASKTSFDCSNTGANSVTLTVTDNSNNVSTCSATVTVLDTISPVANCKSATIYLDANGQATLSSADINNGSSDNCGIASVVASKTSFDCSNTGANSVTLTVTDNSNNVSTCSATVTVLDTISPVANCKPVTIYLDTNGQASITSADINNGSSDNCGIASVVASKISFDCSNTGANSVTLTVTDNSNNVSTCSATVTVLDTISPVASCKAVTIYLDANGQASITSADINNGSSDNCGIASVVASKTSFDCSNTGANSVTLTVTDNSNNVSTCSATVTVLDTISPVANCKPATIYLDANGQASITSADINNGSSDNCGIASVVASKTSFDCSNTGANSVTLTVTDNSNNVSTCSATVTVLDTISPVASCKAATIYLDAIGQASITSADINNGSSDNCGIASVVASKTSFNCSNTGANSVTLTVTDNSNNVSTCSATVTVLDTVSPVASCKAATIYLGANGQASITSADINNGSSDNCGIASVVASKTSFDCSNTGANSVTLTVTDNSNNVSTCSAIVTVLDTISPVASCKPATIYLDANGTASLSANDLNNNSTDNCGIASLFVSKTSFDCSNAGSNSVSLTVVDNAGNTNNCAATVTVLDTISPVASCKPATIYLDANGTASLSANDLNNNSTDNCGIASIFISKTSFDCSNAGSNSVSLTVVDNAGNTNTCSATVTVLDTISPVASCKAATIYLDANGTVSLSANDLNNNSTDNCGIASLFVSKTSFDCSNAGSNSVSLTVVDNAGNTNTCAATVTVLDTISPVASCKPTTIYLDANGTASLSANDLNNNSTDNCGIASLFVSKTSFDCSNAGSNSVSLTVVDNAGNTNTCAATVTVLDTISPVASCKPATIYLDANGQASITSADINNGSSDNCGIASVVASQTSFGCSNTGANSVTLTVTDNSINVSTCSATVTVLDTISPVASCKPATIYLDANGQASITSADINNGSSDNCGIASVVASKTSFDCSNTGANSVTLNVTDNSNNVSTCSATVTVLDTISPVANCKSATIYLDANGQASITSADINNGSSDNCGIASIVASKTSFDCSNTGANSVTLTVTDNSNKVSTCSSTVTVVDTISPLVSCKNKTIYLNSNGQASITVADILANTSDNCGVASSAASKMTFDCSNKGTNYVTVSSTDVNGNTGSCIATVTVVDNIKPVITCPTNISVAAGTTGCKAIVNYNVNYSDNCANPTLTQTAGLASGSAFPLGVTTNSFKVTDASGNIETCSFTVTVTSNLSVDAGTDEKTYFGYSLDQTVNRNAIVTGGNGPFNYEWKLSRPMRCNIVNSTGDETFSNGICTFNNCPSVGSPATPPSCINTNGLISVKLIEDANAYITVTDAIGCIAKDTFNIRAIDARCFSGNSSVEKVKICHKTGSNSNPWVEICISQSAVPAHISANSSDCLGGCPCNARISNSTPSSDFGIHAYPNPANQTVTLEFDADEVTGYELTMFNMTGELILTDSGMTFTGGNQIKVPLNDIAEGVYLLRVQKGNSLSTIRLIVNH